MGLIGLLAAMAEIEVPSLNIIGKALEFINGWAGNICWTMALFTILLKLVTLPLDYMSRKSMKKNQLIQKSLEGELAKLEKQCRGDKALYNQKMMARMKKEGYSMSGACLPSIITLVLFIFIFNSLNTFSTSTTAKTYNAMVLTYNESVVELGEYKDNKAVIDERLVETYKENNPSWLWVKNPMRPDTWKNAIPTYDEITKGGIGLKGLELSKGTDSVTAEANYEVLMGAIAAEYNSTRWGWNGLVILPILAMLTSFLSQRIMSKSQPQMDGAGGGSSMKMMMYLFPILMVVFSVQYTSSFAVYIVANSLFTLVSTLLINMYVEKTVAREFEAKSKPSYRR